VKVSRNSQSCLHGHSALSGASCRHGGRTVSGRRTACRSPERRPPEPALIFGPNPRHDQACSNSLSAAGEGYCAERQHEEVVLENIALRHQLRTLQRTVKRPRLRPRDRMFWVVLAMTWRRWRSALVLVQPDTVVRWHREWLRRRWTRRSRHARAGRPPVHHDLRTLVAKMASANPLWGAPRIHGELRKLGIDIS
jgi:hypothetical protein